MSTESGQLSHLRLLQFLSPMAPVGSYSYSQGLEWAVDEGWIHDELSFRTWVKEQIANTLSEQELPLLARLYRSILNDNVCAAEHWSQFALAIRDTAEFRQEERNRGEAYLRMLESIETISEPWSRSHFLNTPLFSMAWFSIKNGISEQALLGAFAHNWLENNIVTGIKTIPLGQSTGQRLLYALAPELVTAIDHSMLVDDECIGISLPALNMASCCHEVQYSRIYRS